MAIRLGPLVFVALSFQFLAIYAPLGSSDIPRRVLLSASFPLLLAFILANLWRPGLIVLGLGSLLNFIAIVSNGGLMPVSPDTLERVGSPPQELTLGKWVPDSKDVLLAPEDTHLRYLTDTLTWKNPVVSAFSVGDLVIGAGFVLVLGELFLPRIRRTGTPDS